MDVVAEVNEELIAEVLAASTGIPVFKLTEEESSRLLHMEDELHKRVIGNNDAIKALSQAIRRTARRPEGPKSPGRSFIFAGPTGVGKTELAKTLAEFLFGDEDALIQLDMSEFSEKHTVSRLFGSPPGYVGRRGWPAHREGAPSPVLRGPLRRGREGPPGDLQLAAAGARGRPPHRPQGRMVDFKNTVIIMTTNLGTRDISKGRPGLLRRARLPPDYERMKAKVTDELKQHFRPRVPQPGRRHDRLPAVDPGGDRPDRRPRDRQARQAPQGQGHGPRAHPGREEPPRDQGLRPVLGARPLRRTIQREIEDTLSEKILFGELTSGQIVRVDAEGEGKDGIFTFEGAAQVREIDIPMVVGND